MPEHSFFAIHSFNYSTMSDTKDLKGYWRTNVRYLVALLLIWFVVSYGAGILFAPYLNNFQIGGFPLGFWFAQQGSIYVFVVLIFVYVYLMNRLDRKYDVDEK
jgi:putative solute:sodium symporter small subunit